MLDEWEVRLYAMLPYFNIEWYGQTKSHIIYRVVFEQGVHEVYLAWSGKNRALIWEGEVAGMSILG
jgi:hypothetical protein